MTKIGLIIALILLLSPIALAKPENFELEIYNVSFDLGIPHSIEALESTTSENLAGINYTTYTISIKSIKSEAHIYINNAHNAQMDVSLESLRKEMEGIFKGVGIADYQTYEREIDGKPGVVGYGRDPRLLYEIYVAEYSPVENTLVKLVSTFPLEEGTLDLIKTIHVELTEEGNVQMIADVLMNELKS